MDKTPNGDLTAHPTPYSGGLTKREYFAGLAFQALLSRNDGIKNADERAVMHADDLLKALEATTTPIRRKQSDF